MAGLKQTGLLSGQEWGWFAGLVSLVGQQKSAELMWLKLPMEKLQRKTRPGRLWLPKGQGWGLSPPLEAQCLLLFDSYFIRQAAQRGRTSPLLLTALPGGWSRHVCPLNTQGTAAQSGAELTQGHTANSGLGQDGLTLCLGQRFSTGVPQEFLKHAIPGCLVRGTDLFSLRLSNLKKKKKWQQPTQQ